jgi:predicted metal-binding membrane protein
VRDAPPIATHWRRDRLVLGACVVLVTALSWAYLVHLDLAMGQDAAANMPTMALHGSMAAAWGSRELLFTFAMWSVMMVGMMSPSAAPVLLLFAGMQRGRAERRLPGRVVLFGLGYFIVWLAFSALAALAQWGLHETSLLSSGMATTSSRVGGAILVAAGAYQLSPAKGACLGRCRSPLGFLMTSWRDGHGGALRMGLRHGMFCLGCCWALMGVLFVVGVMNLPLVAVLTVFILIEKFGRAGEWISRAAGVMLIASGVVLLARHG